MLLALPLWKAVLGDQAALAGSGSAPSYDEDAQIIFDAFTTPPTDTRKGLIDDVVVALKAAGVWAKLDALYMFAAADSQAALINWKDPGTFDAAAVNSPTFTADEGFTGDASSMHVSTSFNPATAGGNFALDSAHLSVWCLLEKATGACDFGSFNSNGAILRSRTAGGAMEAFVNSGIGDTQAVASSIGHALASRTDASTVGMYKNGASIASKTRSSVAIGSQTITFLSRGGTTQFSDNQVACGSIGAGISSGEASDIYDAIAAYMTSVGAA